VIGGALVLLQFAAIAALAGLSLPAWRGGAAPAGAGLILALGVALGVAALACNRPGNFNIRPEPRAGGQLVLRGPYRWIRHPMYSAVLLCAGACAWASPSVSTGVTLVALAAVLQAKATLEERWLRRLHPAYAGYCAATRRFVPGLY
jgi:protein-S-isoprenylcysteine O-methyltransferase Ste14